VADAKLGAKLRAAELTVGARELVDGRTVEVARRIVGRAGLDVVEDLEMRAVGLLVVGDKAKANGVTCSCSTGRLRSGRARFEELGECLHREHEAW
jgi:hypothetical protein